MRKTFSIVTFNTFFEICEGGYFWRPQTYIHAYGTSAKNEIKIKEASVYVSNKNRLPVNENQTYTLKHTRSKNMDFAKIKRVLSMHVCLKSICLSWKMKHTRSNIHA